MTPPGGARVGPAMPSEANSGGALNETIPEDQKTAKGKTVPSDGPIKGAADEYRPAEYPLSSGNIRQDR
jgi:hypothetical protein